MNFIEAVKIGNLFVEDLQFLDTTGVSGTIPAAAYTNDINIVTAFGTSSVGPQNIILTSNDQVTVGPLPVVSGNAGDVLIVTGENFYQITTVKFGDVSGEFNLVDSETIEVSVPSDADYTGVTVFSSLRSGVNGNTALASGMSPDEFIPIPDISGMSSTQLVSGSTLSVTGFSFGAVTGLRFGSLAPTPVQQTLANAKNYIVPSGNTRGAPSFLLRSGQEAAFPSSLSFSPLADVTGVGPVGNTAKTGELIYISGDNFSTGILYKTGDNYLGTVMGRTIEFGLINDKVASGVVPSGIPLFTSGGNLGAGVEPVISSGIVGLFSDQYPESYPSATFFTPDIGGPIITDISPNSGIAGDFVSIKGRDLYALTGVNFLPNSSANVGIGTYSAGTIAEVVPGYEYSFQVGTAASLGTLGEPYDVTLSGFYGSATSTAGFYVLGLPTITSIDPSGETVSVLPGATGFIAGTNLYSGTAVELWTGDGIPGHYKIFSTLPSSGYDTTNYDEIKFDYPGSFPTGIQYRIKARNRRASTSILINDLNVFNQPFLSGFTPLSGEFGDTITVSGFFENFSTSGLSLGSVIVNDFNQPSTTGFTFQIPNNSSSDVLSIATSGGSLFSSGIVQVYPSKPSISGFYSGVIAPQEINYNQVFEAGNLLTISGERMNTVTGVEFSGIGDSFVVGSFARKGYNSLSLDVPGNLNPTSGKFKLLDFKNRVTESNSTGVNLISVSGFDNYLLPGETMNISGYNLTGMDVLFPYATGGALKVSPISNNTIASTSFQGISVQIPTGIVFGDIQLSGRSNRITVDYLEPFRPLGVITGVTGFGASSMVPTGQSVSVTGINVFDTAFRVSATGDLMVSSGLNLIGFSGSGLYVGGGFASGLVQQTLSIDQYSTGVGSVGSASDVFYSKIDFRFPSSVVGSGNLFLIDPWWATVGGDRFDTLYHAYYGARYNDSFANPYSDYTFPTPSGGGSGNLAADWNADTTRFTNLENKIFYFSQSFESTGLLPVVTGFGPVRGAAGDSISVSGSGLGVIESVAFTLRSSPESSPITADFSGVSDSEIIITVPKVGGLEEGFNVVNLYGGGTSSFLQVTGFTGFTGDYATSQVSGILQNFEVVPAASVVDYNVIDAALGEPSASDRVSNYTVEESVGGVVYLVTKTKFPDGTTMVVSSIPKP